MIGVEIYQIVYSSWEDFVKGKANVLGFQFL